ncbi:MAG TPA: class I SAM-dependent methyltransferase [Thermoanaerobaculia bacterium]|nr:class I SAM-dependent methyltransferase [Thermoanaerobaculia bacterium]
MSDLKRQLAEEIRVAIAEAAPDPGRVEAPSDPAALEARTALRRASETMTPSVPDGAPLSALKRTAIRALRFLWRNQSSFNALSLTAGSALSDSVDRLRAETGRQVDELARRAGVQESRLTLMESSAVRGPTGIRSPATQGAAGTADVGTAEAALSLPAGVYALFEERFRGATQEISRAQRFYLDSLRGVPGPVFDAGCGRGELLRLLRDEGIPAVGVDSNPVSIQALRGDGLEVEEGDAVASLEARPGGSLGAVTAFQLVEHWKPAGVFRFLQAARRALAPGGVIVAETINSDSLSALRAFYLDPTHVRPFPPDGLRFLAEAAGFTDVRIVFRSPLPPERRLEEKTENDRKLNALLFAPQDYAVIGRVPEPAGEP